MNRYKQALLQAREQGFLVSGHGKSWLGCEVEWRRRCTAKGLPTVVVSQRSKRADVYMFLRRVPHADITDADLRAFVRNARIEPLSESQIRIIRGRHGRPNLFLGLSISDISHETAMALAPRFLDKARELVIARRQEA